VKIIKIPWIITKMLNKLKSDSPENSMENYKFRIVRDTNKLVEKIKIFDEGLDDRKKALHL